MNMGQQQQTPGYSGKMLPLTGGFVAGDTVSWRHGSAVCYEEFLCQVAAVAQQLPDKTRLINLVSDRYLFMVSFLAALLRKQVHLLPPNQTPNMIMDIARRYPDSYILSDQELPAFDIATMRLGYPVPVAAHGPERLEVPAEQLAAIAFTSGSTGVPKANEKTWACLLAGARMAHKRFWQDRPVKANIVATVPQQHMYGLETTIIQSLLCGFAIHAGRPFYAEDVRLALEMVSAPRVLVTTPLHIRACIREGIKLPGIHHILSATAPLSIELARQAEEQFQTPVLEIYGCTEAGSIASRRTIEGDQWHAFDGIQLFMQDDIAYVNVPEICDAVELGDIIRLVDAQQFSIHGRVGDLINIAGKRTSLGDLNHKLNAIDGVEDGAFLLPDGLDEQIGRLMAFVVAPTMSKGQILNELRQGIDPVFLPRPLYMVDALPRTASSKLPRDHLVAMAKQMMSEHSSRS